MKLNKLSSFLLVLIAITSATQAYSATRLKEVARIEGVRENALIGYGIVVGLAGTGDSSRSKATTQSIMNTLKQFGVNVASNDINSRNVAAVMITAKLPPFAQLGDKLDVSVSSMGDARSLVGGTLLLAPLKAANDKIYALGQGQISVGGFKYDLNGNVVQKNHPTVGLIPGGASVENSSLTEIVSDNNVKVLLKSPDFTTANRLKKALNLALANTESTAKAVHAGKIVINVPEETDIVNLITTIENTLVEPDSIAKVVINERTGTVVAGGAVSIDDVTISHGNIKIVISTDYLVSQPVLVRDTGPGVSTAVVPDTDIQVSEDVAKAVDLPTGASIGDLITALRQIKTSTRDVITILQSIELAGALHAELVIQ